MERVYGPYRNRGKWRVVVWADGRSSRRRSVIFETEAEAWDFIRKVQGKLDAKTVEVSRGAFVEYLERRGLSTNTVATARYLLVGLTKPVERLLLRDLTPKRCTSLYERYAETRAAASHHGALKQAKAWGAWCVKQGDLKTNPWAGVENIGRKKRGKKQHRIDDAAKLYTWLVEHAPYDDGACAVLMGLVLGLRASEIVSRTVAHLDDRGRALWITDAKTEAGDRPVRLPLELSDALIARTEGAEGPKQPSDRLIPRSRWWVRRQTHRACLLAGVPKITAHALRGSNATVALEMGETAEGVARHLGHADKGRLAKEAYAQAGAGRSAHTARVVERLEKLGKESKSAFPRARPTKPPPSKPE